MLSSYAIGLRAKLVLQLKPKYRKTRRFVPAPRYILDIGIANSSYVECKKVFPRALYHGVDHVAPNVTMQNGDMFFLRDIDGEDSLADLEPIYDVIIANHVLEHLEHGLEVYASLCRLLAPGGVLFVEIPSILTAFRRKTWWRYHFNDDPTHKTFYQLVDLANLAMRSQCKVLSCGPSSTWMKDLLSWPRALNGVIRGRGWGSYTLHFQRKIDHILIQKAR